MVKLSALQEMDLEEVREKLQPWLKKRSWSKYKTIRQKLQHIAKDYPSLAGFKRSNWWINDLKKRAGVGKLTQRQEGLEKKMITWLKARQKNVFLAVTATAKVREEWEKQSRSKPSRTALKDFRKKFKIQLMKNPPTGNHDMWKIIYCSSFIIESDKFLPSRPNRCLLTPPLHFEV